MSKHHLAGSGILIHLMALMTLRGRYYYYLSPNMKKTEWNNWLKVKVLTNSQTAKAQPSDSRCCAQTWYPHCCPLSGTIPCVYMACSILWSILHPLLPRPWLVNTVIPIAEMTTVILRKVMWFCASQAKLAPKSNPLSPSLKGLFPSWPESFPSSARLPVIVNGSRPGRGVERISTWCISFDY